MKGIRYLISLHRNENIIHNPFLLFMWYDTMSFYEEYDTDFLNFSPLFPRDSQNSMTTFTVNLEESSSSEEENQPLQKKVKRCATPEKKDFGTSMHGTLTPEQVHLIDKRFSRARPPRCHPVCSLMLQKSLPSYFRLFVLHFASRSSALLSRYVYWCRKFYYMVHVIPTISLLQSIIRNTSASIYALCDNWYTSRVR